jgi:hypothetical protein
VTTWRTLIDLPQALFGGSKNRSFQSDGEKGDRSVDAVLGESVVGEYPIPTTGVIRRGPRRLDLFVKLAEIGDFSGKDEDDLASSVFRHEPLVNEPLVAVDGCDVDFSKGYLGKLDPGLIGLVKTGVKALRNSV